MFLSLKVCFYNNYNQHNIMGIVFPFCIWVLITVLIETHSLFSLHVSFISSEEGKNYSCNHIIDHVQAALVLRWWKDPVKTRLKQTWVLCQTLLLVASWAKFLLSQNLFFQVKSEPMKPIFWRLLVSTFEIIYVMHSAICH